MALYSEKSGTVYANCPKCGSTSVCDLMLKQGAVHAPLRPDRAYGKHVPPMGLLMPDGAELFTVIREPGAWYASVWRFNGGAWIDWEPAVWHPYAGLRAAFDSAAQNSFDRFIDNIVTYSPGFYTRLVRIFSHRADHVFQIEQPSAIEAYLGGQLPRSNVTTAPPLDISPRTKSTIENMEIEIYDKYY